MRASLLLLLLTGLASAADYGLVGSWPFDGNLADTSGHHRDARGDGAKFAAGQAGQALDPHGNGVEVADHPDLRLAPGLTIDTWVRFDTNPTGYETLVYKDKEYQLRVDGPNEGSRFSFFVYLNGWEPRLSGPVAMGGQWYHLVAKWTGFDAVLEVNGEVFKAARPGNPVGTANPLRLGATSGRLDDTRLLNPVMTRWRELEALQQATSARMSKDSFGGAAGWAGWRGLAGAEANDEDGILYAKLPDANAVLVQPGLDLDLNGLRYVGVDLDAPGATQAELYFVTDHGRGWASLPIWGGGRTSLADLARAEGWQGKLRLLAIALPEPSAKPVKLNGLWVAAEPPGKPYVYLRSVAPRRAILRAGRDEPVIAVLRNLGRAAQGVTVTLTPPPGVSLVGPAAQPVGDLDYDGTTMVSWQVRADRPVAGEATITVGDSLAPARRLPLRFEPPVTLRADYVPEPVPAKTPYLTLMHYCPLWKEGTHYGWEKVEPWPERRPAIGWYDEGTPEVADWQIRYALEHGIQGFIYCWYRSGYSPDIQQTLGHAIHDGLFKARYRDRFKFVIMWENGCGAGCKGKDDLLNNLLPFWIKNYFSHPSYLKIDGKPLLYVWVPGNFTRDLGGETQAKEAVAAMQAAMRKAGFPGIELVGCVGAPQPALQQQMARVGWDASSAYGLIGSSPKPLGRDAEGIATIDHETSLLGQEALWQGKRAVPGAPPDWTTVMQGWDPRPWHLKNTTSYLAGATPANYKAACLRAKALIDATPGNGLDKRVVVFDNWNEFGEGHYLEPTAGDGFAYLDAIRDVFCTPGQPHQDLIPDDVGLPSPERVYLARREILGGFPDRPRKVVDHLLGWWKFEGDDANLCADASACGFHGAKQDYASAPGHRGQGFLCRGGSVSVAAHKLLYPSTGLSIEAWVKTDTANQSDKWLVNTVSASSTGYRLGFGNGHLVWQVPKTEWSHSLNAPQPLPLGRWVHVVATYDNRTLRLYQDGVLVGSLERGGPLNPSNGNLTLGSFAPGHDRAYFEGVLDEVKLYDYALTAEEVAAHAKAP